MIIFNDPDTGNLSLCSKSSSVPAGVEWREVPDLGAIEHRDALVDFDVDGAPVFDDAMINKKLIKQEAVNRMHALFNIINDVEDVQFFAALWQSIAPAARQATPELQAVIDIYTTAKQAIAANTPINDIVWP